VSTTQETSADRVRGYLGRLTPKARSNLLTDIERMQLYGEDTSAFAAILAELRAEFRRGSEPANRIGNPSRHFFKPIEDLFADRSPERANSGQISRGSLSPIWEWISQTLLPAMARDYCESMKGVLIANNLAQAKVIAAGFQSKVVKSLEGALASEDRVKSVRLGLGQYTSCHATIDDLAKILSALQMRDAISNFSEALPPKVDDLGGEALAKVGALLDGLVAKHPQALPFALTIVMKRLKHPWQLVHLATQASRSRAVEDIAATRYALSVPMVLDHLDDRLWLLKQALKSNRLEAAKEILGDIYDIEYELHDWIARLDKSDWGKRLDGFMATLAVDLNAEYRTLPGDTLHVLEGMTRRRRGAGLLHFLVGKGRDALAGGATYYEKLVGSDHKEAS
jgi:hypothetical protein